VFQKLQKSRRHSNTESGSKKCQETKPEDQRYIAIRVVPGKTPEIANAQETHLTKLSSNHLCQALSFFAKSEQYMQENHNANEQHQKEKTRRETSKRDPRVKPVLKSRNTTKTTGLVFHQI
jgi:hypothetical protein